MDNSHSDLGDESKSFKDFLVSATQQSKLSFSYGYTIAKYITGTLTGVSSYYYLRNSRFRKNRDWSSGRIDVQTMFQDRLEMNGKINYTNLNWKSIMICNRVISKMVGAWMTRNEKIQVTAIDTFSKQEKKYQADQAQFVLENKEMLSQLQNQSGVPMVDPNQFVPEDKDELDTWVLEFNQLPEEIKAELGINNILSINGFLDVLKEKLLHDSAETGFVGTYTWMDEEGVVQVEWVKPENALYSYSEYPDFRDTSWRGRVRAMKISEIRKKYGKENGGTLTEEDIFTKILPVCKEYQYKDKIAWINDWNIALFRPYDEWNTDVVEFELRSVDTDGFQIKKTNSGTTIVDRKTKRPEKLGDNKKYVEKDKWNIYRGVYVKDADVLLEWGLKKNMIRPQDPKEIGQAEFSYSFYMYQNNDMRNIAVPEKIEAPLEALILILLKMQQCVARMRPTGSQINIDALQELDFGLGEDNKTINVKKLYDQTGDLYYRGRDAEGNPIPVPIQELQNSGFLGQMQGLIQMYQFQWQVLKDQLGEDPNLSQQALAPRTTSGNVQVAIQASDEATDYMYDAYLYVMEDTARKVGCLLSDSIRAGVKEYSHLMKQEDVKDRIFATKAKMLPDREELQTLQMMLNEAIGSNPDFIMYVDPFKIMRAAKEDVKLGELLFRNGQKRYIKGKLQMQQENMQENAKVQVASQQAATKGEMDKAEQTDLAKKQQIVLTSLMKMFENTTVPVREGEQAAKFPDELKEITGQFLQNVVMPLAVQNQQAQQMMNQQQAQQMNEAQPQEGMEQQPDEQQEQEPAQQQQEMQPAA